MIRSRTKPFIRAIVTFFIMLGLLVTPALRVAAAGPFSVNTASDTHDAASNGICADASGFCSLRAALEEANASGTPTTINLPAGTYNLILGALDVAPNGSRTITLNGAGAASTIIRQNDGTNRVLNIDFNMMGGTNVTLFGVTITGGWDKSDGYGGAGILAGSGWAFPRDSLTLTNCVVSDNHVFQSDPSATNQPGGGLQMAGGDLTITNTTFTHNSSAASSGGAVAYIAPEAGGTVTISNSTFSSNSLVNNTISGPVGGGALFLNSDNIAPNSINISNSNFTGNTVNGTSSGTALGGAILFNTGVLTVDKSVFTGNAANGMGGQGGAIYVDSGTLNMTFSRLKGNTAANGGSGVYNHSSNSASTTAENNWWGCSAGPATAGCDRAATDGANLDYSPWIVLSNTASPNPIYANQTTTLSASFLQNSAGAPLSAAQVAVLLGLPVTWSNPVLGALSNQQTTIQPNGVATATFTAGVVGGTGHADATVDGSTTTANFTVIPVADLALTKSAAVSVFAGNNLTYTITLSNSGPSAAGSVILSDTLPTGTSFVSQSQTSGPAFVLSNTGNQVSNTHTSFPAGASATFEVVVRVSPGQAHGSTLTNTASVTTSAHDPDTNNNSSSATTNVSTSADLSLTKTSPATVIRGTNLTYTLTLTNNGPSDAQTVLLTDTLPAGTTFVSQSQTSGPAFTLQNTGNQVENSKTSLGAGATAVFSVTTLVDSGLPGGTLLVNSAAVNSPTADSNTTNNTDSTSVTVQIPPAISSPNNATFIVGAPGSFTVTATGYPTPALTRSGALPAGVTFTDNADGTATLAGTPASGSGGTYPLTLTAANGVGSNAAQSFTLTVNEASSFTSASASTFTAGTAGSFTITALGYPKPVLTRAGALPAGVTFTDNGNGTATLAGTPAAGSGAAYALTLTAANGIGSDATQAFTLTVNEVPVITSVNNVTFTAGISGSFTVTALGFPKPTLNQTGALPSGVTFVDNGNGTATLAGTPAVGSGGVYPLTFTAANGLTPNAVQPFTLTVIEAPAITSADNTHFTLGIPGMFSVTTRGYPAPSLSVLGPLPVGVTFTDHGNGTGTLSGVPAPGSGGVYPLLVTAHNTSGPDSIQNFILSVSLPPAITSPNNITFTFAMPGSFTVTTTGSPTPAISSSGALPAGVTFTDNGNGTATLAGTPGAGSAGNYPLTITASNGAPPDASQDFTLNVQQAGTSTQLTSSVNPSVYGQPVTFSATVTSLAGTPNGTVQFFVDAIPSGAPVTLSGGVASLTLATLGAGNHQVTASYTGSTDYLVSASQPVNQVVTKAVTITGLSLSYSDDYFQKDLTLTATISVPLPGGGIPTGMVTFKDGAAVLGSVPLDAGGAASFIPGVVRGAHTFSAEYSGDGNFLPSSISQPVMVPYIYLLPLIYK